tara:strand:+ start:473 stop:784 length:312 start_codon:yes stop_codon:yes gene_type:complete
MQCLIGAISFLGFLMLYLMTLPAASTGGRVGLESLRFLDAKLIAVAVVMAALITPTLSMAVFLLGQHRRGTVLLLALALHQNAKRVVQVNGCLTRGNHALEKC